MAVVEFSLSYSGAAADRRAINGYDVSRALAGLERSLAITTHAVLNGSIIVQAPALKGAEIMFLPPEEGSWTTRVLVVLGGIWALNNVDQQTPIGHLLYSAYDYVLNSSTGATLDYEKPMRVLIEEGKNNAPEASDNLTIGVLDGVIERVEKSIEDIHRPIVESETAEQAKIKFGKSGKRKDVILDRESYEFISKSYERDEIESEEGAISSYNINSYTGRIYVPKLQRTVPFVLSDSIKTNRYVDRITNSLRSNALRQGNEMYDFNALIVESVNKRIKRYIITDIKKQ